MSRADELREAVCGSVLCGTGGDLSFDHRDATDVLRALAENCGLSWDMVRDIEMGAVLLGFAVGSPECPLAGVADAIATILEAAGVEEGT